MKSDKKTVSEVAQICPQELMLRLAPTMRGVMGKGPIHGARLLQLERDVDRSIKQFCYDKRCIYEEAFSRSIVEAVLRKENAADRLLDNTEEEA